jgi:hypothetical protein
MFKVASLRIFSSIRAQQMSVEADKRAPRVVIDNKAKGGETLT